MTLEETEVVLNRRARPIIEELDQLECVIGTSTEIRTPVWAGIPFLACKTLISADMRLREHHQQVAKLLRSHHIRAHLTAGEWCFYEWTMSTA